MLASDLSPMAMTFLAMCGGSPSPYPDDDMTSTGIRCSEYQMMIDIEKEFGQACSTSAQCDQVIEVSDSCPTANPVVSISYDAVHLIDMIEEAEMAGCDIDYGSRGDCDSDAEPVCFFGSCTWE